MNRVLPILFLTVAAGASVETLPAGEPTIDGRIRDISKGERVQLKRHLAPGKYTIVEFFHDDWSPDGLELSAKIEAQVRSREDMVLRRVLVPSWDSPVARQHGVTTLPHYKFWDPDGKLVKEYSPKDAHQAPPPATKTFETRSTGPAPAKILTISTGKRVKIEDHLARNQHTIVEFYADW